MDQQQYTFVRNNGQMYHADKETIEVLRAVQRWDAGAAKQIFDRGRENGRIGEGSVNALSQTQAQEQEHGHAARTDGAQSPASPRPRGSGQGYENGH
jgi:hypothetical protein